MRTENSARGQREEVNYNKQYCISESGGIFRSNIITFARPFLEYTLFESAGTCLQLTAFNSATVLDPASDTPHFHGLAEPPRYETKKDSVSRRLKVSSWLYLGKASLDKGEGKPSRQSTELSSVICSIFYPRTSSLR